MAKCSSNSMQPLGILCLRVSARSLYGAVGELITESGFRTLQERSLVSDGVACNTSSTMAMTSTLVTRTPPTFVSKADERTHRLQRLAAACRIFGRYGFADGVLGHVTVRDPEHADLLWINPYGVSMRQMKVSHLVQVNHHGAVVEGNGAINPVGLRFCIVPCTKRVRMSSPFATHIRCTDRRGRRSSACSIRSRKTRVCSSNGRR